MGEYNSSQLLSPEAKVVPAEQSLSPVEELGSVGGIPLLNWVWLASHELAAPWFVA